MKLYRGTITELSNATKNQDGYKQSGLSIGFIGNLLSKRKNARLNSALLIAEVTASQPEIWREEGTSDERLAAVNDWERRTHVERELATEEWKKNPRQKSVDIETSPQRDKEEYKPVSPEQIRILVEEWDKKQETINGEKRKTRILGRKRKAPLGN